MAWRSIALEIATRSRGSSRMEPGAPLNVMCEKRSAGARRTTSPGVCEAACTSSRPETSAESSSLFCSAFSRAV
ncbi:Uncharacterised protein [Mycobacteroides abscessus subsp. abscessus]|nr:Uncharacterised protein [Mycobacteroides abscessus subsp. abscessus]